MNKIINNNNKKELILDKLIQFGKYFVFKSTKVKLESLIIKTENDNIIEIKDKKLINWAIDLFNTKKEQLTEEKLEKILIELIKLSNPNLSEAKSIIRKLALTFFHLSVYRSFKSSIDSILKLNLDLIFNNNPNNFQTKCLTLLTNHFANNPNDEIEFFLLYSLLEFNYQKITVWDEDDIQLNLAQALLTSINDIQDFFQNKPEKDFIEFVTILLKIPALDLLKNIDYNTDSLLMHWLKKYPMQTNLIKTLLDIMYKKGLPFDKKALRLAMDSHNLTLIKTLLSYGADPSAIKMEKEYINFILESNLLDELLLYFPNDNKAIIDLLLTKNYLDTFNDIFLEKSEIVTFLLKKIAGKKINPSSPILERLIYHYYNHMRFINSVNDCDEGIIGIDSHIPILLNRYIKKESKNLNNTDNSILSAILKLYKGKDIFHEIKIENNILNVLFYIENPPRHRRAVTFIVKDNEAYLVIADGGRTGIPNNQGRLYGLGVYKCDPNELFETKVISHKKPNELIEDKIKSLDKQALLYLDCRQLVGNCGMFNPMLNMQFLSNLFYSIKYGFSLKEAIQLSHYGMKNEYIWNKFKNWAVKTVSLDVYDMYTNINNYEILKKNSPYIEFKDGTTLDGDNLLQTFQSIQTETNKPSEETIMQKVRKSIYLRKTEVLSKRIEEDYIIKLNIRNNNQLL